MLVEDPIAMGTFVAFPMRSLGLGKHHFVMPVKDDKSAPQPEWAQLIGAVASRKDRTAFARLFEYFAPRIKTLMLRSGADDARAEELAQETMLTVWRKASLFDPASVGAAAWIFTIARNLRIDAVRRELRGGNEPVPAADDEYWIDDAPGPDIRLGGAQRDQRVRAALAELSKDQQRVVELSFYEEKAHAEIAKQLRIPLGTVKSRLRLAMSRLRRQLGEVQ